MPITVLSPADLRLTIDPDALGFVDTSELIEEPLPWIGQARAEAAARFGLGMDQPNYNLFVLGEVCSGRSSLLKQAIHEMAASRRVPPDLCYLHNFDATEHPPAGEGRLLRQLLTQAVKTLQVDIPQYLAGQAYKVESARVEMAWKVEETQAYAALSASAGGVVSRGRRPVARERDIRPYPGAGDGKRRGLSHSRTVSGYGVRRRGGAAGAYTAA